MLLLEARELLQVKPDFRMVSSLLLLGVFASSLAFVFFVKSVKQLGIAKANIYTNLIPVFTALFSLWILHEVITPDKIWGIVLVIAGVAVSQQGKKTDESQITITNPTIPLQHDKKKRYRFRRRPGRKADGT